MSFHREPLGLKQPSVKKAHRKAVRRLSAKRAAYLASPERQEGLAHMGRVKGLHCVICHRPPPSEAHHCRSGGMARDDFKTIPLCTACHRGPEGYHTRKKVWEAINGPDHEYLPVVADMLAGELTS